MNLKFVTLTAGFTGFIFLFWEIVYMRIASFASQSHPAAFGIVLGVYLLGLGFGAGLSRSLARRSQEKMPQLLFILLLISAILCYLVIPVTAMLSARWFYAARYGLIVLFLAAGSFGGILPLLVRAGVKDEKQAGNRTGQIYAANVAGSTLGSFVCGYLLLNLLPAAAISLLLACAVLLLSIPVLASTKKDFSKKIYLIPLLLIPIFLFCHKPLHNKLYEKLQYMPLSRKYPPFKQVIENRNGVICVTRGDRVFSDGAYDGVISTALSPKINPEIENAYFAFLFHPRPKRILEIGLATGSWAQVLVNGPGVDTLTSVEINPGYLKLIKDYKPVRSLLTNPRFRLVIDDGRRWLRRHPKEKFDLITINAPFHWRSHTSNLLSDEFMKLLKKRLLPGGIVYINTTFSRQAARTIAINFKYTWRYRVYFIASDSPILPDRKRFRTILKDFKIDGKAVLDIKKKRDQNILNKLVNVFLNGTRKEILKGTKGSRIVTDNNMITEFSFIRRHIVKKYRDDFY